MLRKSSRGCAEPGCPNLTREGIYCKEHRKAKQKEYDERRGTDAQRGYGARWRRLRKMFLQANPLCADPFRIHTEASGVVAATEVDHIRWRMGYRGVKSLALSALRPSGWLYVCDRENNKKVLRRTDEVLLGLVNSTKATSEVGLWSIREQRTIECESM